VQVPGYELGDVLGRGGFASVYRAVQVSVGREVAVKIDNRVLAEERDRRRFLREVTAAGRLSGHPHVVGVYDAGTLDDGRPYLVMELCPGGSLDAAVRRTGPLPVASVRDIGIGIADALAAAHAGGVLHRDIKPANILVNAYGLVGLADFGLASLLAGDGEQSATREALTPAYAAPEVFDLAEPTPAADIYSLCATLYTLLNGRPPRYPADGSRPSIPMVMAMHGRPLPDLPIGAEFMSVLRWGLHRDPAQRWPTAAHLRDALAAIPAASLSTQPIAAPATAPSPVGPLAPRPSSAPHPLTSPDSSTWSPSSGGASPPLEPPMRQAGTRGRRVPVLVGAGAGVLALAAAGWGLHLGTGTSGSLVGAVSGSVAGSAGSGTGGRGVGGSGGGGSDDGARSGTGAALASGSTAGSAAGSAGSATGPTGTATRPTRAPTGAGRRSGGPPINVVTGPGVSTGRNVQIGSSSPVPVGALGAIGDVNADGAAVLRAVAVVRKALGQTPRFINLAGESPGLAPASATLAIAAYVRNPTDSRAVERYDVVQTGAIGHAKWEGSQCLPSGQTVVTAAILDACSFTADQLPLGRWQQVIADVIAAAKVPGGKVTSWAANYSTSDKQVKIGFAVEDGNGSHVGVLTDSAGRVLAAG